MQGSAFKTREEEEEEKRKKEREKKEAIKQEKSSEVIQRKDEIAKGAEGMKPGEAKAIVETKLVEVPLLEPTSRYSTKTEYIVKDELAVRLKEEEKKREESESKKKEARPKGAEKTAAQKQKEIEAVRIEETRRRQQEIAKLTEAVKKAIEEEKSKGISKDFRSRVLARLRIKGILRRKYMNQIKELLEKLAPKMER